MRALKLATISNTLGTVGISFFLIGYPSISLASSLTIEAGFDTFRTTGAGKSFSETPLPGNFFDPGSSNFSGLIVFEGDALETFNGINLPLPSATSPNNQVDTVVERLSDATLDAIGSDVTIPVQMKDLALKSVAPVEIINSAGQIELWDVKVRAINNPIGFMTIRREFSNGGTFDADVPIDGVLTFTRRSDNSTRILDTAAAGLDSLVMDIRNAPWMDTLVVPPPNKNFVVTVIPELNTNFFPGYSPDIGIVPACGTGNTLTPPDAVGWKVVGWHGHGLATATDAITIDPCRPPVAVPEPFTLLGSTTALVFGAFFKKQLKERQIP